MGANIDIAGAEEAFLEARSEFERWKGQFLAEWFRPLGLMQMRLLWGTLTPEQHVVLWAADRGSYEQVAAALGLPNIGGEHGRKILDGAVRSGG